MKKTIIALCFLASFKAQSQSADTSITRCIAAKITPIYYSSGIPATVDTITYLGVFDYKDDMKGNCVANWVLLNAKQNIVFNSYTLKQDEYDNWDGSAIGLLAIIGNYLKVKFK
jgi:hypothetical protein